MPTILLTGASGFVGSWIARLCPPTYTLRVLARPTSDLSALTAAGVPFERVDGDLNDPASVRDALAATDGVIHAAGRISFDRARATEIHAANFTLTQTLFQAALEIGVRKVVYTASIFALGYANPRPVRPDSPFNAQEFLDIPYLRAKVAAEQEAQQQIARGLPLVRLYPGICLGAGDRNHSSNHFIVGWFKGRMPALVNGGICYVDVRDAALGHWRALERGMVGERYLLPGYNLTHRQLFTLLSAQSGRPAPPVTVPAWLGVVGAALLERLSKQAPFSRDEARLMTRRWWYDDRPTLPALQLRYRPLGETLRDTLAEITAN